MPKVIRNLLYSLPEDVIRRVYEFDSTYLITQHPELIQEWRDKTHEPEKRKIREYVDQTISLGYRFRTLYGIFSKYRSQIQPGENWLGKDFDIYLMNIKNHYVKFAIIPYNFSKTIRCHDGIVYRRKNESKIPKVFKRLYDLPRECSNDLFVFEDNDLILGTAR